MTETFPPEVAAVRQQFEDWRAAQTQKGPLPKALWQAAAALLPRFPIALVARACRLNPSKLKYTASGPVTQSAKTKTAFHTITAATLQQAVAPPLTEIRFTLERRDNLKLTVTCPAQAPELAAALLVELLRTNPTNLKGNSR